MKNILLVATIFCLTVLSAIYMMTTDNDSKDSKGTKQEKTEQAAKKKEKTQKKHDKEFNIKTQEDLAEIIYSKQDEQTKMDAYNEAIKKGYYHEATTTKKQFMHMKSPCGYRRILHLNNTCFVEKELISKLNHNKLLERKS